MKITLGRGAGFSVHPAAASAGMAVSNVRGIDVFMDCFLGVFLLLDAKI